MNNQLRVWVLGLIVVAFGLGMWMGTLLSNGSGSLQLPGATPGPGQVVSGTLDLKLIDEAWQQIEDNYVDRPAIQSQELTYGAISGMVDALGDTGHSRFLTPDDLKQQNNQLSGSYEGVGVDVQMKNGQVTVVAPIDNSPAQAAGIKSGDVIIKVDGTAIAGKDLSDVANLILGPAGTKVHLTLQVAGSTELRELDLVRQKITVDPVTWQQLPGTSIAHMRIASFSENVADDLKTSLKEAKQAGIDGLVLDLRNNPGGLLNQAVATASQFLSSGNVLLVKDAEGKEQAFAVEKGGEAPDIKMVVLVNNGSASSAEIVAGAIQGQGRAKLVGETTFGTGTVLNTFSLPDGSALLLAIQEWLTPDGRSFWHQGIAPDVQVALPTTAAPLLPSAERTLTADQLAASGDDQLLKAVDMLKQDGAK